MSEQQEQMQAEFEAWIDKLDNKDHMIVLQRACSDLGRPAILNDDGTLGVDEDLFESNELLEAMHRRYLQMYVQGALEDLTEDGLIRPDHVDESGEIIYVKTEEENG